MAQDYEYLPDNAKESDSDYLRGRPSVIESPPSFRLNPFYFNYCVLDYSKLVIRFSIPPPD